MADRSELTAAQLGAELRRVVRHLDRLSVPELLDLREAAEELLRRDRLTAADAQALLDRLPDTTA
jgi:DNA-directed RNA polymerase subunit F